MGTTPEMYEGAPFLLCETKSTDEQSKALVSEFVRAIESKRYGLINLNMTS